MAGDKEIRDKISSIKNTQKITNAMQMVAAAKMRKTQDRMALGRPYSQRMRNVIGHIANSAPEYQHKYMKARDVKNIGYIVVSSDKGLCGGLNINLFKTLIVDMQKQSEAGVKIQLCLIGKKAAAFFKSTGGNIVSAVDGLGEQPSVEQLIGAIKVLFDRFENGEIDAVHLVYNQFVNTMTQKPTVAQLLPLAAEADKSMKHHWDYIYEPEAKDLLDGLMARYVESQVYQAVVENVACEQAAKMIAMKSATDNAGDIIDSLQLVYNNARQAAITQEISEIVSGAAAV